MKKDIDSILAKHDKMNSTQKNLMKTFLMAGATEKDAIEKVQGYVNTTKNIASTMQCPRCTSLMRMVSLYDGRPARYCANDRVCLPVKMKERSVRE